MTALAPATKEQKEQLPVPVPQPPPRPARFVKWAPKRWEVMHQQIVALSTMGKSNTEIAEQFGYSPQQISNIINCPQASIERRNMINALQKGIEERIPKRLEQLADKAIQRIADVLYNDDLAERSPFAVADRGFVVLKGLGKLKDENSARNVNIEKAVILAPELATQIADGLAALKRAQITAGDAEEVKLEDLGEAEIVG